MNYYRKNYKYANKKKQNTNKDIMVQQNEDEAIYADDTTLYIHTQEKQEKHNNNYTTIT